MKDFFKVHYLLFIKIILTIYAIYSLKYLYRLKHIEVEFYMNITYIFIIAAVYMLINYSINTLKQGIDKRLLIISLLMGLYFTFVVIIGTYYEGVAEHGKRAYIEIADFTYVQLLNSLIYIPAFWFVFFSCVIFIYNKVPQIYNEYIKKDTSVNTTPVIFNSIYKVWAFIFICWLPYFILLYPGYISADSHMLLNTVWNNKLTAYNPLLASFYLYFIKFYYHISNNGTLSLALYVVFFQMLPLSFAYAYMVTKLRSVININKNIYIVVILFISFFPVNPLTSILIEKGVLFIIVYILFFTNFITVVYNKELIRNRKYLLLLIALGTLLCLTRHNVVYSFLFVFPFMLIFAKNYRLSILVIFVSIVVLSAATNTFFMKITEARGGDVKEGLSFPMQQIARVYKYHKDSLNENEIKYIESLVKDKNKLDTYMPKISNQVKKIFKGQEFLKQDSIKNYFMLGLKYPVTYLNSVLIMTDALWFPFNNSFWDMGFQYLPTHRPNMGLSSNISGKYRNKELDQYIFNKQFNVKKNNSMLFFTLINQSIFFYVMIFAFIYFVYKRKYNNVFVLLVPIGYTFTILLGPIIYLRYTYYLMAFFPIIIMMLTANNKKLE